MWNRNITCNRRCEGRSKLVFINGSYNTVFEQGKVYTIKFTFKSNIKKQFLVATNTNGDKFLTSSAKLLGQEMMKKDIHVIIQQSLSGQQQLQNRTL